MKWKIQARCRASQRRTLACLWAPSFEETWITWPGGTRLDRVEEAEELLVPVALHAAADHRAVEDIEGGEQGGAASRT